MVERKKEKRGPKTYVISAIQSVQSGKNADNYGKDPSKGEPNINLIEGLQKYCDIHDAELMLLTMNGMNASERDPHKFFGGKNLKEKILWPDNRNIRLNKNCIVSDIIVPPQNVDPSTGRDRHVQDDQTMVFAHSKQRLRSIAAGNAKMPKLLVTTGAVTHPNYNETNHKGDLARREHMYGAVVVEVIDDTYFNIRHVRSFKSGKFIDMGVVYDGKKRSKAGVEALVLGDIHLGDDDPLTMQANYEMIANFKPKRLLLHDLLNGHSVNPHERDNLVSRIRAFGEDRLSIEEELIGCNDELCKFAKAMGRRNVYVVDSNHPFFIDRYLERGDFIHEPWNAKIAFKLAQDLADGKNPVETGIRMMGKLPSNVYFLGPRDDLKVWGWQLASHGHKGISGARGSIRSREIGFGRSITGHTHSPEIQRNTLIVGTSTRLDLPYTEGGMSTWLGANAILYEGGLVQLLPIIKGKWKNNNKKK